MGRSFSFKLSWGRKLFFGLPSVQNLIRYERIWYLIQQNISGQATSLLHRANLIECYHLIRKTQALGNDATARQIAYKKLFGSELESSLLNEIRQATNGGYVLGSDKFKREVALAIGRRTWRGTGKNTKSTFGRRARNTSILIAEVGSRINVVCPLFYIGVISTLVYTAVLTFIILKVIDMIIGLRVSHEDETQGLDISLHEERGYLL